MVLYSGVQRRHQLTCLDHPAVYIAHCYSKSLVQVQEAQTRLEDIERALGKAVVKQLIHDSACRGGEQYLPDASKIKGAPSTSAVTLMRLLIDTLISSAEQEGCPRAV